MNNFQTYQFDFGRHRCTIIRDGGMNVNSRFFFASAPQEVLDEALRWHNLDPANIPSSWHCLYIESGGSKLVVDTGFGSQEGFPQGKLFATLQNLGIASEEIDLVFLSHSHPDHIGGCINDMGQPLYPNARYLISKTEWEFASSEEILSKIGGLFERFARQKLPPLKERIRFVNKDSEILPGISVIPLPGHTPGHLGLKISDGDISVYYLADLFLHPIHVEHPDWTASVDFNPDLVHSTRLKLLQTLTAEKATACLFHFDPPPLGQVVKSPSAWEWKKRQDG